MPVHIQSLQVVSSRARSRNRIARCPLRAVPRPRLAGRVRRDAREARGEGREARGGREKRCVAGLKRPQVGLERPRYGLEARRRAPRRAGIAPSSSA
ncbi:hypothetical protein Y027_5264 [Burkholderia pseudomallei TSV5]|nr:hypothetical protein Y027_5264 [Burkholderia pseudomallei TSV5]